LFLTYSEVYSIELEKFVNMIEVSFSSKFTRYLFKLIIIAVISSHFVHSYEYQTGIENPALNEDPNDDQEPNTLDTSILQVRICY